MTILCFRNKLSIKHYVIILIVFCVDRNIYNIQTECLRVVTTLRSVLEIFCKMRQVCYQLCQTYPIISTAATNHEQENGAERHPAQLRPLTFQGCSSDNRKVCVGPSVFVNLRPAALASYHDNHETAHRQHHPTLLLLSPAAKTPPQIFLMNKELFSVDTSRQT